MKTISKKDETQNITKETIRNASVHKLLTTHKSREEGQTQKCPPKIKHIGDVLPRRKPIVAN